MNENLLHAIRQDELSSREVFPLSDMPIRYRKWHAQLRRAELSQKEQLIPILYTSTDGELTPLMESREIAEDEKQLLTGKIAELGPWGYPIRLGEDLYTARSSRFERLLYRVKLIVGAIEKLCHIPGATVADIGCNHGYFSLELAYRGANAFGTDIREENIRKAEFLKNHFRIQSAHFEVMDAYDISGQFDIVLNLGLLYHVTDPFKLIKKTFDHTGAIAVIDTLTHSSPVSAFIQTLNDDTSHPGEGVFTVELQPTYRAVIDCMHAVGFSSVFEIDSDPQTPNPVRHETYEKGGRRCFIGIK